VLIPAAMENTINEDERRAITAQVHHRGANGPTTPLADEILRDKGVVLSPTSSPTPAA
jgi:glutamate dehydrogenase (NAD(P)+)